MGKNILVPCLDLIMIAFFVFSIRNMVFHCIFLGKKAIIISFNQLTSNGDKQTAQPTVREMILSLYLFKAQVYST